jgi:YD repeat-containing protein
LKVCFFIVSHVKLRGAITSTNFVNNIDYNAKGQRERIQYGNASTTGYTYDEKTFRLKRLLTTRNNGADTLQDLNYTYDPVGNITQIDDNAQQTIYFNGSVVSPSQKFEYDALYRLTKATGREHASLSDTTPLPPSLESYTGDFSSSLMKEDGQALASYERKWIYDTVGNIVDMVHRANSGNNWTRHYSYDSSNNRLSKTTIGTTDYSYGHNVHGSMTSMPHLSAMGWDFAERLSHVTRGTTDAYYNYDGQGQRIRKVVVKGNVTETRLYLGGFEVFLYDNLGQFVNSASYSFTLSNIGYDKVSIDGVLPLRLEWLSQDAVAPVSKSGNKIGTGPYIARFNLKSSATYLVDPESEEDTYKKGDKLKVKEQKTSTFGFKRLK